MTYSKTVLFFITVFSTLFFFQQQSAQSEELSVVGTGDGMAVLTALAKAFGETHSPTTILVPNSIGSSGAIKAVGNDQSILGRVARQIKETEQGYGLDYSPFAKLPVVFVVHKDVAVQNLSAAQILGIYSGDITNWIEVGGNDGKIRVVRREEDDSSLLNLRTMFPGFDQLVITQKSKTTTTTQENFNVLMETPGTIGFGPYPDAKTLPIKILTIDGISPTDPTYPYFTTLALVYKAAHQTVESTKFIEFLGSEQARRIIHQQGGLPY